MGCLRCRKQKLLPRGISTRQAVENTEVVFPVVYVLCRNCGLLRAMRFNLATQFVKVECEECGHKIFHVMKQPPNPELLQKLIVR